VTEFRYFADPRQSTASTWTNEHEICGICGESRPGYRGPYYGLGELKFVCEQCLAAGHIAEGGFQTNEGEPGPPPDRRDELEHRTPGLVTWQDIDWPAHCGDYCRFEREVGQEELEAISDGSGYEFLQRHLHPDQRHTIEWDWVPQRGPSSREELNSPSVYFFRCLVCETPLLLWDVD
jgi:uncharacterized protein CbrC (UPF0167 family)